MDFAPTISQHEPLAYDECHERTSDAHSPPVWTAETGWRGASISDSWKCAAAQRRSSCDSLDWSADVFVGTGCGRRVVRRSRCRARVLDCQGSQHRLEDCTTSVTQNRVNECYGDVSPRSSAQNASDPNHCPSSESRFRFHFACLSPKRLRSCSARSCL